MGKIKSFHKQNNGSTLVIVLTVVAFLSILAVIVTQAAAVNYKMKMVNKQAQNTFYTSEDAVDEIYAALGKAAMESFDEAYNEEMASIVKQTNIGGNNVTYKLSSLTTNSSLRKNFICRLVTRLKLLEKMPDNKYDTQAYVMAYNSEEQLEAFAELLNSYLEEKTGLEVKSVSGIEVTESESQADKSLKNYTVAFKDCHVEYLNENGYYSNIWFDGEIAMPDIYIDFATDVNNMLKTFTEYALIGNTGIVVEENQGLTVNGNIYAGKHYGLALNAGSSLNSSGGVSIVVGGDITVKDAEINSIGSQIWCTGLIVSNDEKGETGEGAVVNINGETYVKDDLQIEGDKSTVNIGGDYYGYSYQGLNSTEGNHNNSSSIIVNGRDSVLNLRELNTLVIGGRAYIDYNTADTGYTTGESLSFMGSQEMYLVPSYLMNRSNPVVGDTSEVTVNINGGNFFGYKYLKEVPYTTRTVEGVTYYYLNFKDDTAASEYVKALFDNEAYRSLIEGMNKEQADEYDKSRRYVQSVVNINLNDLSSTVISTNPEAEVYTNGQMINAVSASGNIEGTLGVTDNDYYVIENGNAWSTDGFILDAYDLSNRYSILTRILAMPEFYDENGDRNYIQKDGGNKFIINGETVDISGYGENNMFSNIISMDAFNSLTGDSKKYETVIDGGIILYAADNTSPVIISDDETSEFKGCSEGIVVATGDVIIKKSFNGTIISGGRIITEGDKVSVSNQMSADTVGEILNKNQEFANIFNGYRPEASGAGEASSLESMTFKDFVEFINWRKSL